MTVRVPGSVRRPVPYFFSLCIHGTWILALWLMSNRLPPKTPSAYDQLIKGKESQIVFYKFKDKLPNVQPPETTDERTPKAEVRVIKQQIVSSPKNAPKGLQVVLTPVPDILPKEIPSPNILAIQPPPIAAPERKKFVPPSEQPKIERALAQPKDLEAPKPLAVQIRLPDQLGAAPQLTNENRMRFVAPEARARQVEFAKPQLAGDAPALASSAPSASPLNGIEAAELSAAIVGLNPTQSNSIPKGSRAADFSAGPVVRPDGGSGTAGKNLTVPNLYVAGGGTDAKPTLLARLNAAPTSVESLRGLSKFGTITPDTTAKPARSEATRVSSAPHPKFDGREVYTMAIQMPNITSYSGSWLMWYSGRTLDSGPVAPPVPYRKVDPKYIATAAEERIEGKVQLLCVIRQNGHVDHVELVRGIDDRLNQSAMNALAKWEFTPASRSGEPVDVDVMVEIPFRLAPKVPK